jgi:hypothetical protein
MKIQGFLLLSSWCLFPMLTHSARAADDAHSTESAHLEDSLGLSDEAVPWDTIGDDFLERPKPTTEVIEDLLFPVNREREMLIKERNETGDFSKEVPQRKTIFGRNPFLGQGEINPGFVIPTGAVWQPVLVIYGEYRTAIQHYDNGLAESFDWANRLDLFANLYLTPTERILVGIRPLDRRGNFSGYRFDGDGEDGWQDNFNANIRSLYFEGDFGELFPNLDLGDSKSLDYGFAVGRMPLSFQDGMMINDSIDAIGITRSSLFLFGSSASRITALWGFNEVNRGDNQVDDDADLFGLFSAFDYDRSTYELDVAYVSASDETGGDGFFAGVGQTRRWGKLNSTVRANFSWALDEHTPAIDTGTLLFAQISRTMDYNDDIAYLNTFWGIDDYTSASRDSSTGGPLGQTGILYEAVGLGRYGSALGNRSNDAVGTALGYQHFFDTLNTKQLVAEIGGRISTDGEARSGGGIGLRYQQALDQHAIFVLDGFFTGYDDGEVGHGARCEMRIKF